MIRGRGSERYVSRRGYQSRLRPHERSTFKPDRVALWAVVLGIALLIGAVTSAHAATLTHALLQVGHHLAHGQQVGHRLAHGQQLALRHLASALR